jgi:S1-C subfamily serine protease
VRIVAVSAGGLAERSGVKVGDRIVAVAGAPAANTGSVIAAVRGALPGTWLPIQVQRGAETIELIVKFPPKS